MTLKEASHASEKTAVFSETYMAKIRDHGTFGTADFMCVSAMSDDAVFARSCEVREA